MTKPFIRAVPVGNYARATRLKTGWDHPIIMANPRRTEFSPYRS